MIFDIWNGTKSQWDDLQKRSISSNIYQSYAWGEYNKISGWEVYRLVERESKQPISISLLVKKYRFGLGIVWCPGYSFLKSVSLFFNNLILIFFRYFEKIILSSLLNNGSFIPKRGFEL